MSRSVHRVVVVGGGITGLTAAYRLAQAGAGDAKLEIDLVERSDRLGGKIFTEHIDNFLVEGGPDTFLTRKPEAIALCNELGLGDRLIPTNPALRRSFVSRRGKLHQLPEGMSGFVPSRLGPLFWSGVLSLGGKLRAASELFVPRYTGDAEESVAAFVRRRLGHEAYDRLVEPLLCGIHAGDGEQLSILAVAPILRDMEEQHGSVLRGLRLATKAAAGEVKKFPTPFVSLAGGLQELIGALERNLGTVRVRTGLQAIAARRNEGTLVFQLSNGEEIQATAAIFATPSFATADLLQTINPTASRDLRKIRFVSNAAVTMGFRTRDVTRALNGYGYVVPRRDNTMVLACSWASSKLPNRAPGGNVLVRVFLGRDGQEVDDTQSDDALIQTARNEVRTVLGASTDPVFARLFRYPQAMPQYTLGHLDRLAQIDRALEATPGVFLAGNSYRGAGIPDCIRSGQQAASNTLRYLEGVID